MPSPWGGEEYGVIQIISSLGNANYHAFAFKALQPQRQRLDLLVGLHLGEVDRRFVGDPHQRRRQPVPGAMRTNQLGLKFNF
jgi:hypothetical protein